MTVFKAKAGFRVVLHDGLHDGTELAVTKQTMKTRIVLMPPIMTGKTVDAKLVYRWDGTVREDGAYRFRLERTDR